jgi:NADH:ubiquinone oxidoreductase subunit 5 (subunit L)/multisubunit Na+/H+ antiporter MnhA subunit
MLKLYVLLYLIPRIGGLFLTAAIIFGLIYFVGWIIRLVCIEESEDSTGNKASKKMRKKFLIPAIIFTILATFVPIEQKQIYPFIAFAGIDMGIGIVGDYNDKNPESMVSTDGLLQIVDTTMNRVNDFIEVQEEK